MNAKKAKALRRLVEHLQTKGVIESGPWQDMITDGPSTSPAKLNPNCGKSIYRAMKKRKTQ